MANQANFAATNHNQGAQKTWKALPNFAKRSKIVQATKMLEADMTNIQYNHIKLRGFHPKIEGSFTLTKMMASLPMPLIRKWIKAYMSADFTTEVLITILESVSKHTIGNLIKRINGEPTTVYSEVYDEDYENDEDLEEGDFIDLEHDTYPSCGKITNKKASDKDVLKSLIIAKKLLENGDSTFFYVPKNSDNASEAKREFRFKSILAEVFLTAIMNEAYGDTRLGTAAGKVTYQIFGSHGIISTVASNTEVVVGNIRKDSSVFTKVMGFSNYIAEYDAYASTVKRLAEKTRSIKAVKTTDLKSFFKSIDTSVLADYIAEQLVHKSPNRAIGKVQYKRMLERLLDVKGVKGLTIESHTQHWMANVYLSNLMNEFISENQYEFNKTVGVIHVISYVDDFAIFGSSVKAVDLFFNKFKKYMSSRGIGLSTAKTSETLDLVGNREDSIKFKELVRLPSRNYIDNVTLSSHSNLFSYRGQNQFLPAQDSKEFETTLLTEFETAYDASKNGNPFIESGLPFLGTVKFEGENTTLLDLALYPGTNPQVPLLMQQCTKYLGRSMHSMVEERTSYEKNDYVSFPTNILERIALVTVLYDSNKLANLSKSMNSDTHRVVREHAVKVSKTRYNEDFGNIINVSMVIASLLEAAGIDVETLLEESYGITLGLAGVYVRLTSKILNILPKFQENWDGTSVADGISNNIQLQKQFLKLRDESWIASIYSDINGYVKDKLGAFGAASVNATNNSEYVKLAYKHINDDNILDVLQAMYLKCSGVTDRNDELTKGQLIGLSVYVVNKHPAKIRFLAGIINSFTASYRERGAGYRKEVNTSDSIFMRMDLFSEIVKESNKITLANNLGQAYANGMLITNTTHAGMLLGKKLKTASGNAHSLIYLSYRLTR